MRLGPYMYAPPSIRIDLTRDLSTAVYQNLRVKFEAIPGVSSVGMVLEIEPQHTPGCNHNHDNTILAGSSLCLYTESIIYIVHRHEKFRSRSSFLPSLGSADPPRVPGSCAHMLHFAGNSADSHSRCTRTSVRIDCCSLPFFFRFFET